MRPVRVAPMPGQTSVWDHPRPPVIEPDAREVVIEFAGLVLGRSTRALKVLETSHPPTWYVPRADLRGDLLIPGRGASFCEWKGEAAYVDVSTNGRAVSGVGWFYPEPSPAFRALRDHVAFYAGRLDRVTVGGKEVEPQPGGFYGGWITPDVVGPFKGIPGSAGW